MNKYGDNFPRKTKIVKISSISIQEIAQNEIKVYLDKNTGFFGTSVKGDHYFIANELDKFLVISENMTYKIISIEDKKFIDTNIAYINIFNPDKVFSLIYKALDSKKSYAKKFKIEKFINNKIYKLAGMENAKVEYLAVDSEDKVIITYKKKPKQKINEEDF